MQDKIKKNSEVGKSVRRVAELIEEQLVNPQDFLSMMMVAINWEVEFELKVSTAVNDSSIFYFTAICEELVSMWVTAKSSEDEINKISLGILELYDSIKLSGMKEVGRSFLVASASKFEDGTHMFQTSKLIDVFGSLMDCFSTINYHEQNEREKSTCK